MTAFPPGARVRLRAPVLAWERTDRPGSPGNRTGVFAEPRMLTLRAGTVVDPGGLPVPLRRPVLVLFDGAAAAVWTAAGDLEPSEEGER